MKTSSACSSTATSAVHVESREFHDIDEQAACLSGYDQLYQQMGRGRFKGEFTTCEVCSGLGIYVEEVNQRLCERGRTPAESHSFGFVMNQTDRCTFNGGQLDEGTLVSMPADTLFGGNLAASTRFCVIDIPKSLFALAMGHAEEGMPRSDFEPQAIVLHPGRERVNRLRDLVDTAISAGLFIPAVQRSEHFGAALQDALIEQSISLLEQRADSRAVPRLNAAQRYKIFCRARDYLEMHAQDPISIGELCTFAAASRRTLEYCFSHVLGEGPASYLRALRLNGIRRELLAGRAVTEPIGDIASRWGLWHLSRFSANYKMMFGELPSQTTSHR